MKIKLLQTLWNMALLQVGELKSMFHVIIWLN